MTIKGQGFQSVGFPQVSVARGVANFQQVLSLTREVLECYLYCCLYGFINSHNIFSVFNIIPSFYIPTQFWIYHYFCLPCAFIEHESGTCNNVLFGRPTPFLHCFYQNIYTYTSNSYTIKQCASCAKAIHILCFKKQTS